MRLILSVQSIQYPITGIGRYTFELARRISAHEHAADVLYFDGMSLKRRLVPPTGQAPAVTISVVKRLAGRSPAAVTAYKAAQSYLAKRALEWRSDYLFHGTNFYLPQFSGPKIVTIHDLSVLTLPAYHPIERVNMLRDVIGDSVMRSDAVIADTAFVKDEIVRYFNIHPDKVHVVHLAHGPEYKPRSRQMSEAVLKKHGQVWKGYVLFVGTVEPRKNIDTLIGAFQSLPYGLRRDYRLLIVGHKGWNNTEVMRKIDQGIRGGWINYVGYVDEGDLPFLYSGARVFAFPSFYEGFGLPVLEAMASGVPVIGSRTPAVQEVAGGMAALFEPTDVAELRDRLSMALTDDDWHQKAAVAGLDYASRFSWDRCAEETLEVYRQYLR